MPVQLTDGTWAVVVSKVVVRILLGGTVKSSDWELVKLVVSSTPLVTVLVFVTLYRAMMSVVERIDAWMKGCFTYRCDLGSATHVELRHADIEVQLYTESCLEGTLATRRCHIRGRTKLLMILQTMCGYA